MKIDGKELAKAAAQRMKNDQLEKAGHESNVEQEKMGDHIQEMASFIEAIHHKNPEKAMYHFGNCYHIMNPKPNEPQDKE